MTHIKKFNEYIKENLEEDIEFEILILKDIDDYAKKGDVIEIVKVIDNDNLVTEDGYILDSKKWKEFEYWKEVEDEEELDYL